MGLPYSVRQLSSCLHISTVFNSVRALDHFHQGTESAAIRCPENGSERFELGLYSIPELRQTEVVGSWILTLDVGGKGLANAARAALDRCVGRALTDTEWERARASLIEYVIILRSWEQKAGTNDYVPCQPLAA